MTTTPGHDSVRQGYDLVAEEYAGRFNDELNDKPLDRALLAALIEQTLPGVPIADVGCGPGHVAAWLGDHGARALGIDLSPGMIDVARTLHPGIEYRVGDFCDLPAADGELGGIVAFYSIIHLAPDEHPAAFYEMHRALRPGGLLLLAFHVGTEVRHVDEWMGHDVDIDFHLDFGATADGMTYEHVCRRTEEFQYGGRVAAGHVTKATSLSPAACDAMAKRLADAGVALTVLPSTDLYLMGRQHKHDYNVTRGVVPAHKFLRHGVNCSLSSNNILNPFTPYGDCSQIRMANLYANVCQVGTQADMRECFNMVTRRPTEMMRLSDYGLAVGKSADLVVLDSTSPELAVAELTPVLYAFKRGRKTVSRQPATLHRPQ